MKLLPLTLATSLIPGLLSAEIVVTTLTATPIPDFNTITIEVEVPLLPSDSSSTDLTGTLQVQLDINPETDQVSELTILNGAATGTPISLAGSTPFIGSYSLESSVLGAELDTPLPPGVVDPATGEFDSAQHGLTVNSGTLSGDVTVFGAANAVAFDFATAPFGGTGSGNGTVTLTPTSVMPTEKIYDVVVILPIAVVDMVDTGAGITIPIAADGQIRAVGTTSVTLTPPDPYLAWTELNSIAGALFNADENDDGVPNGLQWALGLDAASPPFDALLQPVGVTPTTVDFTVTLPAGGSAADITVLVSDDPENTPFTALATGSVTAGNPIPSGTTGTVTISLPKNAVGFLRLSATAPSN